MNKIKQYIEEREEEFDRQFEETYNFYCENDVNGYITNSDDYIKQIDPDGIKDYNTQTIKGLLDVIVEECVGMKLKLEEKNCWTMDSMKMQELPGDAKCYNQAITNITTKLKTIIK